MSQNRRQRHLSITGGVHQEPDVLLVSITDAARRLGIGRSTAYDLVSAGELQVIYIRRCARVPVSALEEFVERRRTSQTAAKTLNPATAVAKTSE